MKKIRFYLNTGNVHGKVQEIVEFEDEADADEIMEAFDEWIGNFDHGWHEVED